MHGVDAAGAVVLRKTVAGEAQRADGAAAAVPDRAGGVLGSARVGAALLSIGHTVQLMAPRFVAPYRKSGKNDGNDAEAICEAVDRPNMRFIPVKTPEQQAVLCLHRVRQGFIEERTATINRLRGLLAEFGLCCRSAPRRCTDGCQVLEQLPPRAAARICSSTARLAAGGREYERSIEAHARENAQLAVHRSGLGPITASAIVASVGDPREFKNGRQFSAWLGLVPASTPPAARRGSATSPVEAIRTCERCSSWAREASCNEPPDRSAFALGAAVRAGAAITAPASPSPLRTLASSGRCSQNTA